MKSYTCDRCGKEFRRKPSNIHGEKKYCSPLCYHTDRKAIRNWMYNNGCTCKDCGQDIINGATRCTRCAVRYRTGTDMKMVQVSCSNCHKAFERSSKRVKPEHNFCSQNCYQIFVRNNPRLDKFHHYKGGGMVEIVCDYCGKCFRRSKSSVIFGNNFCGRKCYADSMRLPDGVITHFGYKKIWVDDKLVYEHRYVMEQHLGRPLTEGEVIHHLDGNKLNNHIDNLQLMTDTEHKSLHAQARREQQPSGQFE